MAQETGRIVAARFYALQSFGRLRRQVCQLYPQQETDPLPLHPGELRQGLHFDQRRPDAQQLSQEGQRHYAGGLSEVRFVTLKTVFLHFFLFVFNFEQV